MPRKVLSHRSVDTSDEPVIAPEPIHPPTTSRGSTSMSPVAVGVLVLVIATAAILGLKSLLVSNKKMASQTKKSASLPPVDDMSTLLAKVSSHILVKTDETPTVATIQDADSLRRNNPMFYKDAQNGDRLLIWSDKAVLFSTSRDLVLAVLPVSTNGQPQSQPNLPPQASATATAAVAAAMAKENAHVEVRNGSGVPGLGKILADELKKDGFLVLAPANAKDATVYPKTVIYVPGDATAIKNTLEKLKQDLNAQVITALPKETAVKGEILVIVGKDYQK